MLPVPMFDPQLDTGTAHIMASILPTGVPLLPHGDDVCGYIEAQSSGTDETEEDWSQLPGQSNVLTMSPKVIKFWSSFSGTPPSEHSDNIVQSTTLDWSSYNRSSMPSSGVVWEVRFSGSGPVEMVMIIDSGTTYAAGLETAWGNADTYIMERKPNLSISDALDDLEEEADDASESLRMVIEQ